MLWRLLDGEVEEDGNYLTVGNYLKTRYQFYHEGLDLRGAKGTAIYSFIFGEVIAWGCFGNYGKTILIKQILEEKSKIQKVFLLAHLSSYGTGIKKGLKIAPGDIIAYAGNSGGNRPVHLHISFGKIATEKLKESSSYREIYKELENNINNPLYHSAKKNTNRSI